MVGGGGGAAQLQREGGAGRGQVPGGGEGAGRYGWGGQQQVHGRQGSGPVTKREPARTQSGRGGGRGGYSLIHI